MRASPKGFSVVLAVTIIAAIGIVVLVAWRMLAVNQQSNSVSNQSQYGKQNQQAVNKNEGYLVIREWGVRVPQGNPSKEMSYELANNRDNFVHISTPRLDELSWQNPECSDAHVSVSLQRARPGDDSFGRPITDEDLENWVKIEDYHYGFAVAQPCFGGSENIQNEIGEIRKALIDAIKHVQKAE